MIRTAFAALLLGAASTTAGAQSLSTDYAAAPAGAYTLDPQHTNVTLKISHLGLSSYTLRINGVRGGYSFDPAHPEATRLQVEMDASAVDAGDPASNRQFADEVLEVARFPTIRFVSTAVKPGQEGRFLVVGDLSLHGQTHPVTLDVIFNGFTTDSQHGGRMGFSADTAVRRSQFGATRYSPMIGDEVSVAIEAEAATAK